LRSAAAASLFALLACACASASPKQNDALRLVRVASGFEDPLQAVFAPGVPGTMYVVEQRGLVRVVKGGKLQAQPFLDVRGKIAFAGEQGLLGLPFAPDYATSRQFVVDYTDTNGDTRVMRYRSNGTRALPSSARRLLFVDQPYPNHNGGMVVYGPDKLVYVGMGDGGSGGDPENRAQNLKSRLGKLLRVNPTRKGSSWQIVGFGLRNPWRFSFDRANGNLWIGDVGQNAWEEVDFRKAARVGRLANYGWSRFEGRSVYDPSKPYLRKGDAVSPVLVYSHSAGCSITGGYVYRGSAAAAERGRYVYGDFCSGTIWSFPAGANGKTGPERVDGKVDQLSSFGQDGNGELYACSLNGTLYKLK